MQFLLTNFVVSHPNCSFGSLRKCGCSLAENFTFTQQDKNSNYQYVNCSLGDIAQQDLHRYYKYQKTTETEFDSLSPYFYVYIYQFMLENINN